MHKTNYSEHGLTGIGVSLPRDELPSIMEKFECRNSGVLVKYLNDTQARNAVPWLSGIGAFIGSYHH